MRLHLWKRILQGTSSATDLRAAISDHIKMIKRQIQFTKDAEERKKKRKDSGGGDSDDDGANQMRACVYSARFSLFFFPSFFLYLVRNVLGIFSLALFMT